MHEIAISRAPPSQENFLNRLYFSKSLINTDICYRVGPAFSWELGFVPPHAIWSRTLTSFHIFVNWPVRKMMTAALAPPFRTLEGFVRIPENCRSLKRHRTRRMGGSRLFRQSLTDGTKLCSGDQFSPNARTSPTASQKLSEVQAILFFLILTKAPR